MSFDASRIQNLSEQISSAQNGFKTASHLQRALKEASRPSLMGGILQNIAKPPVIAGIGSYQNIAGAGFARYHQDVQQGFGLSSSPVTSAVQEVARSMGSYQAGLSENTPSRLAFSKLQAVNGFSLGALASRVQSFNKMADLTRGLTRPYDLREGDFMSSLGSFTATLQQLNGLTSSSAFSMIWEVQTQKVPPIAVQVAQAVSEGARASSGWKPLLDDLKEYRLRDAYTVEAPLVDTVPHPPDTQESEIEPIYVTESTYAPADSPYQLKGKWTVFQPAEIALYNIWNGPLLVKVLLVGPLVGLYGHIVILVIEKGVAYILHYCC